MRVIYLGKYAALMFLMPVTAAGISSLPYNLIRLGGDAILVAIFIKDIYGSPPALAFAVVHRRG